jgi:hypothetical protein
MWGGERALNFGVSRFQLDLSEVAFCFRIWYLQCMASDIEVKMLVGSLRGITGNSFAVSLVGFYDKAGFLTSKQVSAGRELVRKMNVEGDAHRWSLLSDGLYIDSDEEETFIQVYKVFSINGKRSIRRRGLNSASWATVADNGFAHQRILKLLEDGDIRLLSFDEMVEIGRRTGLCCICGRSLDDAKSIEAGIGPVCAKKVMAGVVPDYKDEVE